MLKHSGSKGLTPVERKWRCRLGEIDLVARRRDAESLSKFASARASVLEALPAASVNTSVHDWERAIGLYLSTLSRTPPCRVDAVPLWQLTISVWLQNIFGD